jgi:hypothetical protein
MNVYLMRIASSVRVLHGEIIIIILCVAPRGAEVTVVVDDAKAIEAGEKQVRPFVCVCMCVCVWVRVGSVCVGV